MNVFDFDKTIYDGDSTQDFYFYSIKKHPSLLKFLYKQVPAFIKFGVKKIEKTEMKEQFYIFLSGITDIDKEVDEFWLSHKKNIKAWYKEIHRDDDVIISASPEFLLAPICKELNVKLIASRVDKYSGKYTGQNCYGGEKVLRFKELFCADDIEGFYSDSYSDSPMARLASKSYLINKEKILPW